jgi:hypothetical protein
MENSVEWKTKAYRWRQWNGVAKGQATTNLEWRRNGTDEEAENSEKWERGGDTS